MSEPRKPFWVKCLDCSHVWAAAYVPMEVSKFCKAVGKLHCPNCAAGAKRITPAKQDCGVLQEPAA